MFGLEEDAAEDAEERRKDRKQFVQAAFIARTARGFSSATSMAYALEDWEKWLKVRGQLK